MSNIKRIYKFPTGATIPKDAQFLATLAQTKEQAPDRLWQHEPWVDCWHVWHYFLCDVPEAGS